MSSALEKYLLEAIGKNKGELSPKNPYVNVGFDKDKKRLGWLKVTPFGLIRDSLTDLLPVLEGKENFIFVGMGGSINGIKTLFALFKGHKLFTLDSLDPAAIEDVLRKIKNIKKTLVIAVSKSGTTQETQLLSTSLKELFKEDWQKHFLWLADPVAFEKIDSLGWQGSYKHAIQFDSDTDVGGRFSSPHTLIFFLPLFLLLKRDFQKLEKIYENYVASLEDIRQEAYLLAEKYKNEEYAYFHPVIKGNFGDKFSSWIVQLFQESLGSKKTGFAVKTTCLLKNKNDFLKLTISKTIKNPVASLMAQMYFFQVFIAYYAALKNINFVDQDFVEKYKEAMRSLENAKENGALFCNLKQVLAQAKKNITQKYKFIEVVLYFYPSKAIVDKINKEFAKAFPGKMIFVFVGSDWNHHSYQAAFADENTYYVFLLLQNYNTNSKYISKTTLVRNVEKLKIISKATYLTLKSKSCLLSIAR